MHACGHDTHVAMLVGAARLLAARRDELAGRVLFMFQPGEEGHHGARFMLDEGLLDAAGDGPVDRRLRHPHHARIPGGHGQRPAGGAHAWPSADTFRDRVSRPRRPRLGAAPRARPDPGRVRDRPGAPDHGHPPRRRLRPGRGHHRPASHAGTTNNVIPETAELLGTIRAVSERTRAKRPRRRSGGWPRASPPPTRPPPRWRSSPATRSPSTTATSPPSPATSAADAARADDGHRDAAPGHGRRGLLATCSSRYPGRWSSSGPRPPGVDPAATSAQPLQPGRCSTRTRWPRADRALRRRRPAPPRGGTSPATAG